MAEHHLRVENHEVSSHLNQTATRSAEAVNLYFPGLLGRCSFLLTEHKELEPRQTSVSWPLCKLVAYKMKDCTAHTSGLWVLLLRNRTTQLHLTFLTGLEPCPDAGFVPGTRVLVWAGGRYRPTESQKCCKRQSTEPTGTDRGEEGNQDPSPLPALRHLRKQKCLKIRELWTPGDHLLSLQLVGRHV